MRDHPLPDWVDSDRLQSQQHIVSDIVDRFKGRNGHPEHNVVFLQAPTGTGKTLIAEMVRRQLRTPALYTCTTKALQDQFVRDFKYAKVLKGRSNYPTVLGLVDELGNTVPDLSDSINASDCDVESEDCRWCGDDWAQCPYVRARGNARSADLAVLNTAYMLTDAKGPRRFTHRGLTILDEADTLESNLLNYAELNISQYRMKTLSLDPPKYKTKEDTWDGWLKDQAIPAVQKYLVQLRKQAQFTTPDRKLIRDIKSTNQLFENLARVLDEIPKGRWVYDGYNDSGNHPVIFRPVYIQSYGEPLVWNNGYKFLLMSATILADSVMASELGISESKQRVYSTVDVPSEFPIENRPVHVVPVANMAYSGMDEAKPLMTAAVNGVLRRHPDERILVHCVSYDLAGYLHSHVHGLHDRLILTYRSSREKDNALADYKRSDRAVLFAASMDRGVDLPDDACRVQIIAKVPYPNLADKRVNARLYSPGGQSWYLMHTVRTIVQMAGRAVRHKEDYAITYVLDKQFVENVWKNNSRMFPKYFRDALNFRFNPRLLEE